MQNANPPPPDPAHAPKRRPLTKAQRLVLQERALELKIKGESYAAIGRYLSNPRVVDLLGLPKGFTCPKVQAFRLVDAALEPIAKGVEETAEKLRRLQLRQHDDIIKSLWEGRGDAKKAMALKAHMERVAKLKGLDAPTEVKFKGEVASTPGLPLSEMTDEQLARYEQLVMEIEAARAAKTAGAAAAATAPAAEDGAEDGE